MNYIASQNTANLSIDSLDLNGVVLTSADNANYSLRLPATQGTNNQTLLNNGSGVLSWGSGGGSGNVVAPASSVVNNIATFNNTSGTLLKDSGVLAKSGSATSISLGSAYSSTAVGNVFLGKDAGNNSSPNYNISIGYGSGVTLNTGSVSNILIGTSAGYGLWLASASNVIIGDTAGSNMTTGCVGNTILGSSANVPDESIFRIAIGATAENNIGDYSCQIGESSTTKLGIGSMVLTTSGGTDGKVLMASSSTAATWQSIGTKGSATLVSGTVTVSSSAVKSTSVILITCTSALGTLGKIVGVPTKTANTSFVITSYSAAATVETGDVSVYDWIILN